MRIGYSYPQSESKPVRVPLKIAAAAGIIGPVLFGGVLVSLTVVEYRFIVSIGWSPLLAPTHDWPSGLALGPYGWMMTAAFILAGLLMACFGFGLRQAFSQNRAARRAAVLVVLAGGALIGLASPTDLTIRTTPATWHGRLHDLSYVALGLTLLPAMLAFGFAFRSELRWRGLANFTWLVAVLAIPAFVFKGLAIYIFLALILAWGELAAFRLWRIND
jgi:hypothetical protein